MNTDSRLRVKGVPIHPGNVFCALFGEPFAPSLGLLSGVVRGFPGEYKSGINGGQLPSQWWIIYRLRCPSTRLAAAGLIRGSMGFQPSAYGIIVDSACEVDKQLCITKFLVCAGETSSATICEESLH